jgi:predicted dehydrogenase
MTRVAVIGGGAMGRNHARVYSEMPSACWPVREANRKSS